MLRDKFKLAKVIALFALVTGCGTLSGCGTFIGLDHPALRESMDFGPPQTVSLCVLLDRGVSRADADSLLSGWNEEGSKYGLYVQPVSYQELPRDGFFFPQIMSQLDGVQLGPSCERTIYFVNRNVGDFVYGLASISFGLPEVLGEVDDDTLTRGYVVAKIATPNQIFMTPSSITRHEIYHLLGCSNHFDMPDCYRRIRDLKSVEERLTEEEYYPKHGERPFYPTYASHTDSMLISRAQVNTYEKSDTRVAALVQP